MEWVDAANTIWQCLLQHTGVVDLPCSFSVDDPDLTQTSYKLTFGFDLFLRCIVRDFLFLKMISFDEKGIKTNMCQSRDVANDIVRTENSRKQLVVPKMF